MLSSYFEGVPTMVNYYFGIIVNRFSRHFRDILQPMSYPSRSHRGRYRRVTVPFEYYSQVIATPRLSGWVASRAVYQPAEQ